MYRDLGQARILKPRLTKSAPTQKSHYLYQEEQGEQTQAIHKRITRLFTPVDDAEEGPYEERGSLARGGNARLLPSSSMATNVKTPSVTFSRCRLP